MCVYVRVYICLRVSACVCVCLCVCVFQTLSQLTCSYETENQTRYVSCDLGNPMKSGTSVSTRVWLGAVSMHIKYLSGFNCQCVSTSPSVSVYINMSVCVRVCVQLWAGLRFTVPRLRDTRRTVQFELQIRRWIITLSYYRLINAPQTINCSCHSSIKKIQQHYIPIPRDKNPQNVNIQPLKYIMFAFRTSHFNIFAAYRLVDI